MIQHKLQFHFKCWKISDSFKQLNWAILVTQNERKSCRSYSAGSGAFIFDGMPGPFTGHKRLPVHYGATIDLFSIFVWQLEQKRETRNKYQQTNQLISIVQSNIQISEHLIRHVNQHRTAGGRCGGTFPEFRPISSKLISLVHYWAEPKRDSRPNPNINSGLWAQIKIRRSPDCQWMADRSTLTWNIVRRFVAFYRKAEILLESENIFQRNFFRRVPNWNWYNSFNFCGLHKTCKGKQKSPGQWKPRLTPERTKRCRPFWSFSMAGDIHQVRHRPVHFFWLLHQVDDQVDRFICPSTCHEAKEKKSKGRPFLYLPTPFASRGSPIESDSIWILSRILPNLMTLKC